MRQPIKFGKYLLLERIAVGGMAEVFAAKAFGVEGFERLLAIKKILPTMGEDPEFISMFVDEARIAVQLSHANIVQVLELGKHEESLYIAMEYISGRDLRQLLERYRKQGKAMPLQQACTVVARVCEALDYAHRKRDAAGKPLGIVHRDVSPQNVLVSFDGDVKLIDFGIAKAESRLQRTQAGILKGKFSYMSPEQVKGLAVDHRSDVFAAGVLMWELLCGKKLFTGDSDFAVLEKVRKGEVPPPRSLNRELPEAVERVVLKALAVEPQDRYQWCSELHDDLLRFTLLGETVYGSRQLAGWMREEFRAEHDKEQARMRDWLAVVHDEEPTPPDFRRRALFEQGAALAAGGGVARRAAPPVVLEPSAEMTQEWRVPVDSDTLVQPPTPTGRGTQPILPTLKMDGEAARPLLGPLDKTPADPVPAHLGATQMLQVGAAAAPQFDNSGDLTAARRALRTGGLTRPDRARGAQRRRWLLFSAAATLLVLLGVGYMLLPAGGRPAGKLIVSVTPPAAAELIVDGRPSGALPPYVRVLPPGTHKLEVRANGYKPFSTTAEVGAEPVEVQAALEPAPPVQVEGVVLNAKPDAPAAAAPAEQKPAEKRRSLLSSFVRKPEDPATAPQVAAEGARKELAPGAPMAVEIDPAPSAQPELPKPEELPAAAQEDPAPQPQDGPPRLHIMSEPLGAQITLAGKPLGRAPLTTGPLEADRYYPLTASLEGYVTVRRAVKAGTNGTADVTLALPMQPVAGAGPARAQSPAAAQPAAAQPAAAQMGYLVAATRPVARVSIDGRETGRWTPVPAANPIALPAGAHTIVFETADGKRHEEKLQIEPGRTSRLVRELPQ